jgi:hypothetical protein
VNNFGICINNQSNPASLILGKVDQTLPGTEAESHALLRVIDEDTSESNGYLYPTSMFASLKLPQVAQQALMAEND